MSPGRVGHIGSKGTSTNGQHDQDNRGHLQGSAEHPGVNGTVVRGSNPFNNRLLCLAGEIKEAVRFWREQCLCANWMEPKVYEMGRIGELRDLALTGDGSTIEEKARGLRIWCEQARLVTDQMEPFLDQWLIKLSSMDRAKEDQGHGHVPGYGSNHAEPVSSRDSSLGSLRRLTDALIIEGILVLLTAKDLCSLALTSRFLHVFSRNDVVWRRLFLAERHRGSARLVFRGTWLLTYLFPSPEHDVACKGHPLVTHPVNIQGVFSEYLQHQWLRSNMSFNHFYPPPSLPPSLPPTLGMGGSQVYDLSIPLEDYQSMDPDTFYRRYAYPGRPVMIQNSGVESWPAWQDWTLDALLAKVRLVQIVLL
ncbi:hypothetical protein BGZ65_010616 [Modicella reniformis]|uniref:F-box domain-containing protein n=1 Tax=Modicella reniformis TaxID=1440133 RepID=A0A9P6IHI4_9FUNG|nr:hypothetical protein BGZ65_010616 [Modicella reniformis]